MEIKQGYKQTDIGVIPSDWEVKEFQDVMDGFSSGQTPYRGNKEFYKGDIPWITSGELNYNTITDTIEKITKEGVKAANLKVIPKGTFLFAITGLEAAGTRGSCAITGIEATTNQSCMALYPKKGKLITEYLFHYYIRYGNELAFEYCQGTKQQSYTGGIAKKLPIILPSTLAEQTAIATALSDADSYIASIEKLIEKKRLIKQGAMQQLLSESGFARLKDKQDFLDDINLKNLVNQKNPDSDKWVVKKLGEIFVFHSTANFSKAEMSFDGKIGCLHYGLIHAIPNVKFSLENGVRFYLKEDTTKYELIKDGDILMVDASEDYLGINKSIEVSNVSNRKYIAGLHTYLMRDENAILVNGFRGLILNSTIVKQQFHKLAVGMKVYGVSKSQLKDVLICYPNKEAQTRIAAILSDMDNEIATLEKKLSKAQSIKQGMMQQLLTGKIRLNQDLQD